ncbi:MAG: tRNA pseudouridine(38-40) synthase TruA [Lachnospiraceae bacterium]|nr:tRNA pseudouridine(38-40) synthase TruA [Lachnospiraceae bacterium]
MAVKNYKMIISYDGTRYFGWEHQPNRETVQGKLESVIGRMVEKEVEVLGAGRTDAGVHAQGMCAHVLLDTELSPDEIRDYCNRYLPDDIAVVRLTEASPRFHARYNATGKTYRYTIYNGKTKPVFDRKYVWTIEEELSVERMQQAAGYLQGRHDFAAFCKAAGKNKSTERNVDRIDIRRKGEYLILTFHGDGFLRNMVRILTGTLVAVGRGEIEPETVKTYLAEGDRRAVPATAPAQGLCLIEVDYD